MICNKHHSVGKDGTGITAMEATGFPSTFVNRANISQDVIEEQGSSGCPGAIPSALLAGIARTTTWH